MLRVLVLSLVLASAPHAFAQSAPSGTTDVDRAPDAPDRWPGGLTLQAGLIQPVLFDGGNVAVSYKRDRWVADYSHGFNLDFNARGGAGLLPANRDQNLDIDVPWTTGFGIGYRITPRLDVRAEAKAHRYSVTPPGEDAFAYTTFTVGPGVYYEIPVWRALTLEPSVRYWPTVGTTLDGGEREISTPDGGTAVHEAYALPPIVNVSVGWTL